MIKVESLAKSFRQTRAVDGVSFRVAPGELFGLLGPNGAGKTTTVSMISGLLRPDRGSVFVGEYNLWDSPKPAKRLLGLVPQEPAIYEEFTARENLHFWGGLYGLPKAELKRNCEEILKRVGLAERAREPVSRYSGGMKRRLNLAIGLVHGPKVLLLDEPTVGIDPQARNSILELIREIAREGTTIIFTTHHLEEAERVCDRIAIMDHGRILQTGTVRELASIAGDRDSITLRGNFAAHQMQQCLEHEPVAVLSLADQCATIHLMQEGYGIAALAGQISRAGIELTDLSVQKPTLESVFLKLTGRQLRD